MDAPAKKDPFKDFESLVDQLVRVDVAGTMPIAQKIDALERLIEKWRIDRHKLINPLEFEEFEDWGWFADIDKLHFVPNSKGASKGFGTAPIRLQRKLLVFLLLHHGRYRHVLEVIDGFIGKIRTELKSVDFKKTKTGVFRCYTNTRFAALRLRDNGLLKFTDREAYKNWVLSLPGFLVAAVALASPDWTVPPVEKDPWHDLDPLILQCCGAVADYPTFVATLSSICKPNSEVFESFKEVLQEAHRLLQQYWATLNNEDLPKADRMKLSRELIDRLDNTLGYGEFLTELSACIQVEDLLKKADAAANKS